jgi:hypothetical protein
MYSQKCNCTAFVPNFHIREYVSDLYSPTVGPPILQGRAVSFLGIFVSNFRYSVFAVWGHWIRILEGENEQEK